jgi:uncharacterized RDD family membrane protein YckC
MGVFAPPIDKGQPSLPAHASFGQRLGAFFVDFVCAFLIFMVAAFAARLFVQVAGLAPALFSAENVDMAAAWRGLSPAERLFVVLNFFVCSGGVYYPLFHSSPWQATLGKRLVGIQVADHDGGRLGFARAVARAIAKFGVHLGGWLTPVSVVMILLDKRRRALHDAIAGTVVLRGRAAAGAKLGYWRVAVTVGVPFVLTLGVFRMMEAAAVASAP